MCLLYPWQSGCWNNNSLTWSISPAFESQFCHFFLIWNIRIYILFFNLICISFKTFSVFFFYSGFFFSVIFFFFFFKFYFTWTLLHGCTVTILCNNSMIFIFNCTFCVPLDSYGYFMLKLHTVYIIYTRVVSQGRKKAHGPTVTRTQDPSQPCEHPDHRATEPHGRPATISPCLIRFVPESARNHAGTDETIPLPLAAQARTHTEPPNVTGEEKAHGPTGTRTQDLSHTVRALWPLSYRATRSICDNFPLLN